MDQERLLTYIERVARNAYGAGLFDRPERAVMAILWASGVMGMPIELAPLMTYWSGRGPGLRTSGMKYLLKEKCPEMTLSWSDDKSAATVSAGGSKFTYTSADATVAGKAPQKDEAGNSYVVINGAKFYDSPWIRSMPDMLMHEALKKALAFHNVYHDSSEEPEQRVDETTLNAGPALMEESIAEVAAKQPHKKKEASARSRINL